MNYIILKGMHLCLHLRRKRCDTVVQMTCCSRNSSTTNRRERQIRSFKHLVDWCVTSSWCIGWTDLYNDVLYSTLTIRGRVGKSITGFTRPKSTISFRGFRAARTLTRGLKNDLFYRCASVLFVVAIYSLWRPVF